MAEFEQTTNIGETELTRQVIFCVGEELFGVDVMNIKEIVPFTELNKVPNSPNFIKGVLDFRGKIISVIIPQIIFGIEIKELTVQQIILVIQTENKLYGILVDRVFDIVNFKNEDLQIIEELHENEKTKYLKYFGKLDDKMIMFIDPEKLIDYEFTEIIDVNSSAELKPTIDANPVKKAAPKRKTATKKPSTKQAAAKKTVKKDAEE